MGTETSIAWTDHSFNPVWGCTRVSDGCRHCYAAALALRMGYQVWGPSATRRVFGDKHWAEPVTWDRSAQRTHTRRRVFVGSMCDWCDPHPAMTAARPRLWALIRQCSHLDWLLLTKRAERIEGCLPADWGEGYANVWLGTSVENNDYAWRAETLALIPAAVRFVSCEPALGPLDRLRLDGIDWVIYGGESGPGYRAHDPTWARDLLARCRQHPDRPAFFFKQSSARRPGSGVMLDGQIIHEYPVPRTP
ncbi:MAG TPA: DUF5131 family protein [Phycisphaerae bacterium]|nr:DUF5131 family protein [Phycisphaerae bacterium]